MRANQVSDVEYDAAGYVGTFESSLWLWVDSVEELGIRRDHVLRGTRWFDFMMGVILCPSLQLVFLN
jgi:hypothetical protein